MTRGRRPTRNPIRDAVEVPTTCDIGEAEDENPKRIRLAGCQVAYRVSLSIRHFFDGGASYDTPFSTQDGSRCTVFVYHRD